MTPKKRRRFFWGGSFRRKNAKRKLNFLIRKSCKMNCANEKNDKNNSGIMNFSHFHSLIHEQDRHGNFPCKKEK